MDLFLTNAGIDSRHWPLLSDNYSVTQDRADIDVLPIKSVLWIVTSVTGWQDVVKESTEKGLVIIVLYTVPSLEEMTQAIAVGARGYCTALADVSSLQGVRATVTAGGLWIPATFMGQVTKTLAGLMHKNTAVEDDSNKRLESFNLTQREKSVVLAVLDGLSNKQIADKLFISERTIKEHLGNIFRKLQVKDRLQLVLLIMKN